jgi:heme exporter protein CcmD
MNTDLLDALAAFVAMGGYAGYVWGSLAMCALAFAIELAWLRRLQRDALRPDAMAEPHLASPRVHRPVVTRAGAMAMPEPRP